jgi:type VI secretion system protein
MTLVLKIINQDSLASGDPPELKLERRGALIGRSGHTDWCLPDQASFISGKHCEVVFQDGRYVLRDTSTNGTIVNGQRMSSGGDYVIEHGDEVEIGHYIILALLDGAAAPSEPKARVEPETNDGWNDIPGSKWSTQKDGDSGIDGDPSGWGREEDAFSDRDARNPEVSDPWARNDSFDDNPQVGAWGAQMVVDWAPPDMVQDPNAAPVDHSLGNQTAVDVWDRVLDSNDLDWDRFSPSVPPRATTSAPSGFSAPPEQAPAPAATMPATAQQVPFVQAAPAIAAIAPSPAPIVSAPVGPTPTQAIPTPSNSTANGDALAWQAFLRASGLNPQELKSTPEQAGEAAGAVLLQLVGGLLAMVAARAKAKAELGAQSTTLDHAGNNPLKFTRVPEMALTQVVDTPLRGFMPGPKAIEDSFRDLQAHQIATLAAMKDALRGTTQRFSPDAIKGRASKRGVLAKIIPAAHEAALWQDYERQFQGVAAGSDEAFMDVFAKAFKKAYEETSYKMKHGR